MNFFYFVLAFAFSFIILTWMALRSGKKYSVNDTEAHATDYAGQIREGHGGLTMFLWITFGVIFVWTIIYLVQHWSEFNAIFQYSSGG